MSRAPSRDERAAIAALVRRSRGRDSIETAAARAPMSPVTWARVEAGETVRQGSYAGVETALGWTPGSVARFIDTGENPCPPEVPQGDGVDAAAMAWAYRAGMAARTVPPVELAAAVLHLVEGDEIPGAFAPESCRTCELAVALTWRALRALDRPALEAADHGR